MQHDAALTNIVRKSNVFILNLQRKILGKLLELRMSSLILGRCHPDKEMKDNGVVSQKVDRDYEER